jgi:hypothetical protein
MTNVWASSEMMIGRNKPGTISTPLEMALMIAHRLRATRAPLTTPTMVSHTTRKPLCSFGEGVEG